MAYMRDSSGKRLDSFAVAPKSARTANGEIRVDGLGDSLIANGGGAGSSYIGTVHTGNAVNDTSLVVDYALTAANGYSNVSPPTANLAYVIEYGTANEEWIVPSAVSGTGPYTLTVPALAYAHPANSPIRADPRTYSSQSPVAWMALLSGNRFKLGRQFAHGGYTCAQVRSNLLPLLLAQKRLPAACLIDGGTNDNFDLTAAFGVHLNNIDDLIAAGILPVVLGAQPSGSVPTSPDVTNRAKWNARLAVECARRGIPFIDSYSTLADGSSGNGAMAPNYATDNTHPGPYGVKAWAQQIVNILANWFPYTTELPFIAANQPNGDSASFPLNSNNALLLTDTNADGLADGFSQSASTSPALTFALVTKTGVLGKLQSVTRPANATGTSYATESFTLVPGHRYRAYINLDTSGVDAAYTALATTSAGITNTSFAGWNLRLIVANSDYLFSLLNWKTDVSNAKLTSPEFVAPNSGYTGAVFAIALGGGSTTPAYTVSARCWLEDLTALGVV
jgi:lysophospholipase L1-like esterase